MGGDGERHKETAVKEAVWEEAGEIICRSNPREGSPNLLWGEVRQLHECVVVVGHD